MSCKICVHDGSRECDAESAEIKCMICGRCQGWVDTHPDDKNPIRGN